MYEPVCSPEEAQEDTAQMMGRPRSDRAAARQARHGRGRWLAVAGYSGLALSCLALAALAFLLVAPPLDRVRDRLVDEVKSRTGRTLVVAGPMSVALFPRVVVSLNDVAMLPPDGVEGAPTVTVPSLDVETSLPSLISRRPRLDRVILHRPTVDLVVDAKGRRSWDLTILKPRSQRPPAAETGGDNGASTGLSDRFHKVEGITSITSRPLRPWAVCLVDATVRYHDDSSGSRHEISGLNLDITGEDWRNPAAATVNGTFVWQGEPWHLSGTGANDVRDGRQRLVTFKLSGAPVEATFHGTLSIRGDMAADGTLSLGPFAYKGVKFGPSTLVVSVADGVAKVTLRRAELYDGAAEGTFTLDTTGPLPAIATNLKLSGVSLRPLLGDAAGVDWIDGSGALAVDLTGQGRSERQVVESLQGKVQVAVADGAITGIDIDKSMRALQRGRLDRLAPRREDRTPFSELSGTFDIADGVARNQDLKLASANLQLSGEGTIELAPRRIDYTLQTKIAGNQPEEGAAFKIGTIELPIGIKGSLDRPEFTIKGQEGLTDTIKQIRRNWRSREVQDAINGLLSGDGEKKRVKPADLIEKLLKKE
jgi:uncharacterized protein involved in outer membrane biogenesis